MGKIAQPQLIHSLQIVLLLADDSRHFQVHRELLYSGISIVYQSLDRQHTGLLVVQQHPAGRGVVGHIPFQKHDRYVQIPGSLHNLRTCSRRYDQHAIHAYADRLVHRVIQFAGIFVRTGEYDAVAGRICISFYMLAYLRKELAVHNGRYDTYGAAASAADLGCRIVGYIAETFGNLAYARNRLLLDLAIRFSVLADSGVEGHRHKCYRHPGLPCDIFDGYTFFHWQRNLINAKLVSNFQKMFNFARLK